MLILRVHIIIVIMKDRLSTKERLTAVGLGLVLALGAAGCSTSGETIKPTPIEKAQDPEPPGPFPEVISNNLYMDWLDPAEELLKKSSRPEAKSLLEFINNKVVLKSKPSQEVPAGKAAIQLVRSYKEMPASSAQTLRDPFTVVIYNEPSNTIYLDNNLEMTGLSKGLGVMHELLHAQKDNQEGKLFDGEPTFVVRATEEIRVYDLMAKILDDVMGDSYHRLVDEIGQKILETGVVPEGPAKDELQNVFGANLTDYDTRFLGVNMIRNGFFRAAEKVNPTAEEALRVKIGFQLDLWKVPPEAREQF